MSESALQDILDIFKKSTFLAAILNFLIILAAMLDFNKCRIDRNVIFHTIYVSLKTLYSFVWRLQVDLGEFVILAAILEKNAATVKCPTDGVWLPTDLDFSGHFPIGTIKKLYICLKTTCQKFNIDRCPDLSWKNIY